MMMDVEPYEYTKNHKIVHFKCTNCMIRELRLKVAVI